MAVGRLVVDFDLYQGTNARKKVDDELSLNFGNFVAYLFEACPRLQTSTENRGKSYPKYCQLSDKEKMRERKNKRCVWCT